MRKSSQVMCKQKNIVRFAILFLPSYSSVCGWCCIVFCNLPFQCFGGFCINDNVSFYLEKTMNLSTYVFLLLIYLILYTCRINLVTWSLYIMFNKCITLYLTYFFSSIICWVFMVAESCYWRKIHTRDHKDLILSVSVATQKTDQTTRRSKRLDCPTIQKTDISRWS